MKQTIVLTAIIIAFLAGIFGAFLGRSHLSFISADVTELANDLGQERSKNITLSSELKTTISLLNESNSQLKEISNQFQDAQNKFSRLSIEFASCTDQLRKKINQLGEAQGQIQSLSERVDKAEASVRFFTNSDLNHLQIKLREAQEQIIQLESRAHIAESRVKDLEPKLPTGPSLEDRWQTIRNSKFPIVSLSDVESRMGKKPTIQISGLMRQGYRDRVKGETEWFTEFEQSDWETKIFPRYKVSRAIWPVELSLLIRNIHLPENINFYGVYLHFCISIWVLEPQSTIGIYFAIESFDPVIVTLPRSALPEAK